MKFACALTILIVSIAPTTRADDYSGSGPELPITYFSDRDPGPKPAPIPGGGYWPLVSNIDGGYVSSIETRRVQRWRSPKKERFNGLTYWTLEIEYGELINTKYTYRRPQLARTAKAYVRGGVVQFWRYTDVDGYVQ